MLQAQKALEHNSLEMSVSASFPSTLSFLKALSLRTEPTGHCLLNDEEKQKEISHKAKVREF